MFGEQPLKFYSDQLTETKIELVHRILKLNARKNSIINLNRKHKERFNEIAS